MRIATWNVNSIRARHDRAVAWLAAERPDVLLMQEIKVEAAGFPREAFEAAGYQLALWGQKSYNGVAIASRHDLDDVVTGFGDGVEDPEARIIWATVQGVRVGSAYVPNGQSLGSDKFAYKLAWLARLRAWLERHADPAQPLVLGGDYNIAPTDLDVYDPAGWAGHLHCSTEERAALARLLDWGLADVFRALHPTAAGAYSWWDYRGVSFFKNQGLRIDHLLATAPLVARATTCEIDKGARKGQNASDHAPVIASFRDP